MKTPKKRPLFKVSDQSTSALKAMLNKGSGASSEDVKRALSELKKRGESTPPPAIVLGSRGMNKDRTKMNKGGVANCGASMRPTQDSTKNMAAGGMLKKADNPGLKKLPTKVRNNMGYMYGGGYAKKK